MQVIEKNDGTKIPYKVVNNLITFDDTISVNLAKYQKDEEVIIDICFYRDMQLGFGVNGTNDNFNWYVANIAIPPRKYDMVDSGQIDENNNPIYNRVALPLNMDDVTLYLWALPDNYIIGGAF